MNADQASSAVPERPLSARLAAFALPFVAGPAVGSTLAAWLVPGSALAQALTFFVLPLAMIAGLYAWIGLALFTLLGRLVGRLARGERTVRGAVADGPPPGSFVFVPLSAAAMGLAGVVCGLLPSSIGFLPVTLVYAVCGAAYGGILHGLARRGYLQFPDEL